MSFSQDQPSPQAAEAKLGVDGRILEGIVTTAGVDGAPHVSPMGPIVDERLDRLWLRPFQSSTTFANLRREGAGVFHITDDVELIARAAVGQPDPPPRFVPGGLPSMPVLADACRWYAFQVESIDESAERAVIAAQVVERGVNREFLGFNRAKHAVLEAAILATRIHLIPAEHLQSELSRLRVIVEKTGAAAEHRAFDFLTDFISARLGEAAS